MKVFNISLGRNVGQSISHHAPVIHLKYVQCKYCGRVFQSFFSVKSKEQEENDSTCLFVMSALGRWRHDQDWKGIVSQQCAH